jgi:hypothetical protein
MSANAKILWPEHKRFAFTIFDDTDRSTVENVGRVYAFLHDVGFRTTKSVWPLRGLQPPSIGGATCEDPTYLQWVLSLQQSGVEIGYHNATYHTSSRQQTVDGLDRFKSIFGHYPFSMANHHDCEESIFWGEYRVSAWHRALYNLLTRNGGRFRGHIEGDPLFWGDHCKEKIKYMRNFVFADINTLKSCPYMPYHDASRPFVQHWFASSEGSDVYSFNRCISEENQDRLENEGGACIMYTHLAYGFQANGSLQTRFVDLMERLSSKQGWFVPVSTLLDFLKQQRADQGISTAERAKLERRWLLHKLQVGTT